MRPLYLSTVLCLFTLTSLYAGDAPDAGPASSAPAELPPEGPESPAIKWGNIFQQSLELLGVEHGFRYLTEEGTRHPHAPFWRGYVNSLGNLHGWADGDPFYVNYVGHPMQGAAAGYIFIQNDPAGRALEFGKDTRYWKSRLRAAAFSWAYSEQFEVGPLSEASIGNTQASYPQQGLVDQVVTPAIGFAWIMAEDSIDKYFIKRVETWNGNPVLTALLRGGLNPTRSLANMLAGHVPWHRDSRLDPREYYRASLQPVPPEEHRDYPLAARAELFITTRVSAPFGQSARGACAGGGGAMAIRVAKYWEMVGDISGCKMTGFGDNISGDSLTYLVGPRWTPQPEDRWQPFVQVLIGGRKLTHEKVDPAKRALIALAEEQQGNQLSPADHPKYSVDTDISGTSLSAGGGLDLRMTSALGLRLAQLNYMHSWHANLSGVNYSNTVEFTSGLVLRFGTW